jgi:hypothetical protein
MTTEKKTTAESSDGKIVEPPEWGPAALLSWLSARLADAKPGGSKDRMQRASRISLALSMALGDRDDEALSRLDAVAAGVLRGRGDQGDEVSWATGAAIDRDGELIRGCARILAVFGDGADALDALNLMLRRMGFAKDMAREEVARRLDPIALSVEMTPSAVARAVLSALGWTREELKNFGAKLTPNGSRKR